MGWVGLEPTTNALKGRCSTIELPTLGKRSGTVSLKWIVASGFEHHATDNGTATHERGTPHCKRQNSLAATQGQSGASVRRQTPDHSAAGLSTSDSFRHAPSSLSKKGWAGGTPAQRVQVDVMKLR
jgi:hypothetical protein